MNAITKWLSGVLCLFACVGAHAQPQPVSVKDLAQAMQQGGYVIVFRHGGTNRDQADTDPLNYDNVAKQRLLSENGKQVAKQVGDSLKALRIPIGAIYTSKYNRAVETGKLIGATETVTATLDVTEGGLVATPIENDRRAETLRKMAATKPESGKNTLIVTHKPNIIDAFGKDWFEVKEGEASVFRPDGAGNATLIARVQAGEWIGAVK